MHKRETTCHKHSYQHSFYRWFSVSGVSPQIPTWALPLDPTSGAGVLLSSRPLFCPCPPNTNFHRNQWVDILVDFHLTSDSIRASLSPVTALSSAGHISKCSQWTWSMMWLMCSRKTTALLRSWSCWVWLLTFSWRMSPAWLVLWWFDWAQNRYSQWPTSLVSQ